MKLASLKHGRDGGWSSSRTISPGTPRPRTSRRRCRPRSTTGTGLRPPARTCRPISSTRRSRRERFHEHDAAAPLPRAYQWADGSAYVNHVALVRQARGAEMPESSGTIR